MVANQKRMMQSMSSLARTTRKTGKSRITKKPKKSRKPRITRKPRQTIPTSLLNLLLANKKCLIFSTDFNTMSALFLHQWPTCEQIIDSRGG